MNHTKNRTTESRFRQEEALITDRHDHLLRATSRALLLARLYHQCYKCIQCPIALLLSSFYYVSSIPWDATELQHKNEVRSFGLATATDLEGPWKKVTHKYATREQLKPADGAKIWTEVVSHCDVIRSGYNQLLEYDANNSQLLIQGLLQKENGGSYASKPYKLGIIKKVEMRKSD